MSSLNISYKEANNFIKLNRDFVWFKHINFRRRESISKTQRNQLNSKKTLNSYKHQVENL